MLTLSVTFITHPSSMRLMDGHEVVVQLLLEREDVDVNAKDKSGCTALLMAAACGHE